MSGSAQKSWVCLCAVLQNTLKYSIAAESHNSVGFFCIKHWCGSIKIGPFKTKCCRLQPLVHSEVRKSASEIQLILKSFWIFNTSSDWWKCWGSWYHSVPNRHRRVPLMLPKGGYDTTVIIVFHLNDETSRTNQQWSVKGAPPQ